MHTLARLAAAFALTLPVAAASSGSAGLLSLVVLAAVAAAAAMARRRWADVPVPVRALPPRRARRRGASAP